MILQDLQREEAITLEIVWGSSSYEIATKVIAINGEGIIISPFSHNGVAVDLGAARFKDIFYNIFAIRDGQRIGWKNVHIKLVTLTNKKQGYLVTTFNFAKNGTYSERRNEERTIVNTVGFLWRDDKKIPIRIYDISSKGISFFVSKGADLFMEDVVAVEITDKVRGEEYDITVNCRMARRAETDYESFVGCTIAKATRDLLVYVFAKRLAMAKV